MNEVLKPSYFYRETVQSFGKGEGKFIRSVRGRGLYAHVDIAIRPLKRGDGLRISWEAGSSIPARFATAVVEEVHDVLRAGVLAGLEIVDVHASIENGSYHDEDSTTEAFREAARRATVEALRQAKPVLLEALAQFNVNLAPEHLTVVKELAASLGGRVIKSYFVDQELIIEAQLPAPLGFDFMAKMIEATESRITISITFAGYEIKPEPPDTIESWVRSRP